MKKSLALHTLILFLAIAYSTVSAQNDYVVTIKGDTLRGRVKLYMSNGASSFNSKYVQLTPVNGKKSRHDILQTRAFRMDDEIYHPIRTPKEYTFMKVIESGGYLSLYGYQLENQPGWDGRYFVKKDGGILDVPNLGFKKRVTGFLADCPNVTDAIQAGTLSRSDLLKIVKEYNTCIDLKTNARTITKKPVTNTWTKLETEVKALPEFDKKADALEMIHEIQGKISKNETVPAFLINGLKDALKDQTSVTDRLNEALTELGK